MTSKRSNFVIVMTTVLVFVLIIGLVVVFFATRDKDLGSSTDFTVTAVEPGVYTDEESGVVYELVQDSTNNNHPYIRIIEDPNHVLGPLSPEYIDEYLHGD